MVLKWWKASECFREPDSQNESIQEMNPFKKCGIHFGVSSDVFFSSPCPDQDEIDGTTNPTKPEA